MSPPTTHDTLLVPKNFPLRDLGLVFSCESLIGVDCHQASWPSAVPIALALSALAFLSKPVHAIKVGGLEAATPAVRTP
jgi:hypothetical protein